MAEAYIYDAVRTPRGKGKKDGKLHEITPIQLATQVLQAVRDRTGIDTRHVDDVILGCLDNIGPQAGDIARTAALAAGLPCVVGTDAAPSGLTGRIRCVAPDEVGAALAELLAEPAAADAATAAREAAWTRTLHDLVATPTAPDPN